VIWICIRFPQLPRLAAEKFAATGNLDRVAAAGIPGFRGFTKPSAPLLAVSATGSSILLITDLLDRKPLTVTQLLAQGVEVLLVATVGFSVIYWQLDRGGPDGRMRRQTERLAFWFTQDAIREYSDEFDNWQPLYLDYFYLSFTNITAFSPTDTLPLTRTAKMLMMWQSLVSIATLAIVLAFAINSLG